MNYFRSGIAMALAMGAMTTSSSRALAVSYASNVTVTGTTVNFILNSPADVLSYSINGGAPVTLDGSTKGAKTFSLTNANDTFSIIAERNNAVGYTIPTGGTVFNVSTADPPLISGTHGLKEPSAEAGFLPLTDVTEILTRFNSPRGIGVSKNPNAPNFGTAYVANSAAGTNAASGRTLGDGIYALRSDQSDAYGFGDAAANPIFGGFPTFDGTSANSPYRVLVGEDGEVYVTDWSDSNGGLYNLNPQMTTAINVLDGFGGPSSLPSGQNHGSIAAAHVEGSLAKGNLVAYTIDEDLTTAHLTGSGSTTDQNSLWRYEIGSGPVPFAGSPTRVTDAGIPIANSDVSRGADGKWYISQSRFDVTGSTTLYVVSPDGTQILWNSMQGTRDLKNDQTVNNDLLQYAVANAVSPDQKWLALMLNGSDVAILPLVDGIPQLADRMVVKTTVDPFSEFSGRDIDFDAAGNIHYVSSGQGRYTVLAPGGHSIATTSWNGTEFVFDVETLTAPGGLDGDFNGDDVVDGADFLVWQRGGSPNPTSQADLTLWKNNFGATAATPAVGAVPEPASTALVLLAGAGLFKATRRRQAGGASA